MQDGFIKVATATPDIRVADCSYNAQSILSIIKNAAQQGVHLLVFPELCITGYTCGDLFLQDTLLNHARQALEYLCKETQTLDIVFLVGLPLIVDQKTYNCAAVVQHGKILGFVPKTNLPNYAEFYEARHFNAFLGETIEVNQIPFGTELLFRCQNQANFCFAAEICEDLWVPSPPSIQHTMHGATIIANLSASNELVEKNVYRKELVVGQSSRLVCAYLYADAGYGESTTDMVFSGHNLIAENGALLAESPLFQNTLIISEIDVDKLNFDRRRMTTFCEKPSNAYREICFSMPETVTRLTRTIEQKPFVPEHEEKRLRNCQHILQIQAKGLQKRIEHTRAQSVVLGISGGLDSTLALLVALRTMELLKRPTNDIIAITMPCFGTTKRTRNNASRLCEELNIPLRCIDISQAVLQHFNDIDHDPSVHDVTYENAQARERTQILMDIANANNGLVIGTGDLSELALGWATYNGDQMSMYAVNASVPKTLVRHLVEHEANQTTNERLRAILLDILDTPVSPELLPPTDDGTIAQKTEDLVGPYELHDFFLYYAIRWAFPPKKVYRLAQYAWGSVFDNQTIYHWLKIFYQRFFSQQFKRSCMPDGPKVGSVSLSPRGDWRMPSDACVSLWLQEIENLDISNEL